MVSLCTTLQFVTQLSLAFKFQFQFQLSSPLGFQSLSCFFRKLSFNFKLGLSRQRQFSLQFEPRVDFFHDLFFGAISRFDLPGKFILAQSLALSDGSGMRIGTSARLRRELSIDLGFDACT